MQTQPKIRLKLIQFQFPPEFFFYFPVQVSYLNGCILILITIAFFCNVVKMQMKQL
jgi:hypothetical protein